MYKSYYQYRALSIIISDERGYCMNTSYENYQYYRNRAGLSDYQLAQKAGVSRTILSDWKNEKHYPHNKTLKKIADALEVTVNDFYINPNTDYVIKADGHPIAVVESNGTVNIAALNNRITAYSVMLLSGEAVTLTADEYKELQTAIDIYIDSWVRSKKATG